MQFHVLVHGTGREGTADKVQQLLSSIKITPELLHQPGPDKPLVIKRRFNETQASALRDKLIGLGLQSSIQSLREPGLSRTSATPEKPAPLSAALKQLSQTMQGLLRKPSAAQVATATRLGRLSAWMLCIRVLFRPFLGTVALPVFCALLISVMAWLLGAAFSYSFLLGLLLVPLFLASLVYSAALIGFFLWPRTRGTQVRLPLQTRDAPQLTVFIATIGRVLKAPPPTLFLTMDKRIRAGLVRTGDGSLRASVEIPLPLLFSLNLTEFASLLAGECGRLVDKNAHPPLLLAEKVRLRLRSYMEQQLDLTKLQQAGANLRAPFATSVAWKATGILQAGENWRVRRIRQHLERMDMIMTRSSVSRRSGELFRDSATNQLEEKIEQIAQALNEQSPSSNRRDQLLVDQVAAYVAAKVAGAPSPRSNSVLVTSVAPIHSLIKDPSRWDKALSRLFYERLGLRLQNFSLLSHGEVLKRRRQNDHYRQLAELYFAGWLRPRQFWQLPLITVNTAEMLRNLNRCIAQLRQLAPERNELIARQERLRRQMLELQVAKKLGSDTFKFIHNPPASAELSARIKDREIKLRECNEELFHQNSIMGERLILGLTLAQQRGARTAGIITALSCLAGLRSRLDKLQLALAELEILKANSRRIARSAFATYQRELNRSIATDYQFLVRQFGKCPYDFCEPGIPTLEQLFHLRCQQLPHQHSEQAERLLEVLDEAHERISQRAAGIAARMESDYEIEKIRRLPSVDNSAKVRTERKSSV